MPNQLSCYSLVLPKKEKKKKAHLHTVSSQLQLLPTLAEPLSNPSPVQVSSWVPSRPWKGPAHESVQLSSPLYLQGLRYLFWVGELFIT